MSWWVQQYIDDGTEHGYTVDPAYDQEFQDPVKALQHIQTEYGKDFVSDQWGFITSDGDAVAWKTDVLGVTMSRSREFPEENEGVIKE